MTWKRAITTGVLLAAVGGVVLFAAGTFGPPRVAPGGAAERPSLPAPAEQTTVTRAAEDVVEEAVGTVRSRRRVVVAAQVQARVVDAGPQVGDDVRKGDVVARLDDRELAARAEEAKEVLAAAEAARRQAEQAKAQGVARLDLARSHFDRVKSFVEKGAATIEQVEAAQAGLAQATAGVADAEAAIAAADARIAQARQGVAGAEILLGFTTIAAPQDGVVAERSVEPGDLAWPGRPLLVVLDAKDLRLDAQVREGLLPHVRVGAEVPVDVPSAGRTVAGTVSEVVPFGDPRSRTFEVRIAIPADPALRPGMFGRARFVVGSREVVRVPAAAVRRVGQLETVVVRQDDRWVRRLVTTGAATGDGRVEVLAGLRGGETVAASPDGAR